MAKSNLPLDQIKGLYSSNLSHNGVKSTAVGWNSTESQALRFDKLTSVIEDYSAPVSVNDYGCGYGAHLDHLVKARGIKVAGYAGYDLSEEMLAAARAELSWFSGDLSLICSPEISTISDYTFVSGTFNVRFEADDSVWKEFIEKKLDEIDAHSRCGFSFNLLSTYVDWKEEHLFYGDPCYWFDLCKRKYSTRVSLLHDYPLYEWTIFVRK
ncbi:methyltransferase domain protein [Synechococcus sp. BIOS-E4-1]|uniref:class I SAM-dependent methyltransferase n=1 Tax=Synechococcus sp. BIOS-E4-1 TaxID=1400864 RepID=UPI001647256E|nr:class I SAM-dependent methyltransferase [Synechococcus sp. BIOS-E4-1]QNI52873.1 methyltransferase domain protein [Synechococcus sp. BIOS-E4-1]